MEPLAPLVPPPWLSGSAPPGVPKQRASSIPGLAPLVTPPWLTKPDEEEEEVGPPVLEELLAAKKAQAAEIAKAQAAGMEAPREPLLRHGDPAMRVLTAGLPLPPAVTEGVSDAVESLARGATTSAGAFGALAERQGRKLLLPPEDPKMSPQQAAALERLRSLQAVGAPGAALPMLASAAEQPYRETIQEPIAEPLVETGAAVQEASRRGGEAFPRPEYAEDFWAGMKTDPVKTLAVVGAENLPNLLITMGASAVNPALGVTAAWAQETGAAYQEAKQQGASEEEAQQISGWVGATNMFLEYLPAGRALKALKGGANKEVAKGAMRALLEQAAAEGGTESVQELNGILAQALGSAKAQNLTLEEVVKRVGEAGIAGLLLGAAAGGAGAAVQPQTEEVMPSVPGRVHPASGSASVAPPPVAPMAPQEVAAGGEQPATGPALAEENRTYTADEFAVREGGPAAIELRDGRIINTGNLHDISLLPEGVTIDDVVSTGRIRSGRYEAHETIFPGISAGRQRQLEAQAEALTRRPDRRTDADTRRRIDALADAEERQRAIDAARYERLAGRVVSPEEAGARRHVIRSIADRKAKEAPTGPGPVPQPPAEVQSGDPWVVEPARAAELRASGYQKPLAILEGGRYRVETLGEKPLAPIVPFPTEAAEAPTITEEAPDAQEPQADAAQAPEPPEARQRRVLAGPEGALALAQRLGRRPKVPELEKELGVGYQEARTLWQATKGWEQKEALPRPLEPSTPRRAVEPVPQPEPQPAPAAAPAAPDLEPVESLRSYAGQIAQANPAVVGVDLVGSRARGAPAPGDTDLVYRLDIPNLPEDPADAAQAVEERVETLDGLDLDRGDTHFQVGDRYFHLRSGAGQELVENTDYAQDQAGKPRVPLVEEALQARDEPAADPRHDLAARLWNRLIDRSKSKMTAAELFQEADQSFGGTQAEGSYGPKDATDVLELAVNLGVSDVSSGRGTTIEEAQGRMGAIEELTTRLPTQTRRSGKADSFQQFSTPPHYAYVVGYAANIGPEDVVLEPSAGTGSLVAAAKASGAKEISGADLWPHRESLERAGVFSERIQYTTRYFIPTGEKAVPALEKVTQSRPVSDVIEMATAEEEGGVSVGQRPVQAEPTEAGFLRFRGPTVAAAPAPRPKFTRPEAEAEFQKAREGVAPEGALARIKEGVADLYHRWTRVHRRVPAGKRFARFEESLRLLEHAPDVASDWVAQRVAPALQSLTDAQRELFDRSLLVDNLAGILGTYDPGTEIPFLEPSEVPAAKKAADAAVAADPVVQKAVAAHHETFREAREELSAAYKKVGMDPEPLFKQGETYLHHQVLEYADQRRGLGARLKKPMGRSWQRALKGSKLPFNLHYLQAQGKVLAEMRVATVMARELAKLEANYDIAPDLRKEAKAQDVKDWRSLIPEGYDIWQPQQGSVLFPATRIVEDVAENILLKGVAEVTSAELAKGLMLGGPRKQMVLPTEIVETLNELNNRTPPAAMSRLSRAATTGFKKVALFFPRRIVKYLFRNYVGDTQALTRSNPKALRRLPQAASEIRTFLGEGKMPSPEFEAWHYRGGMTANLRAQELTSTEKQRLVRLARAGSRVDWKSIGKMVATDPVRGLRQVWRRVLAGGSATRIYLESLNRYASYLEYLDQIRASKEGRPANFGASTPEEIMALEDPEDRAYWLSNQAQGAYDQVTEMGRMLRTHVVPFYSFQELAVRSNYRLLRNELAASPQASAGYAIKALGRQAPRRSPFMVLKAGKFLSLAYAFEAMMAAWNRLLFDEEDDELPDEVQKQAHITFGRTPEGNVLYFNRLSAFEEVRDWFGIDEFGLGIMDYLDGRATAAEVAQRMLMQPIDKAVGAVTPLGPKGIGELLTGKSTFPKVAKPRDIEDRGEHLARMAGAEKEYRYLFGKPDPSRTYLGSWSDAFLYTAEPGAAAYFDSLTYKKLYLRSIGKDNEGYSSGSKTIALRNMKRALRYKQEDAALKYLAEYIALGGKESGIDRSLDSMDPLFGIKKEDDYREFLSAEEEKKLDRALKYYKDVLKAGDEFLKRPAAQKILSAGKPAADTGNPYARAAR